MLAKLTAMILLAFGVHTAMAQPGPGGPNHFPQLEELQETIRFIRLAETRKALDFSDETLLQLNELLDQYEAEKFQLLAHERELTRTVHGRTNGDVSAETVRDLLEARQAVAANQAEMWEKAKNLLTEEEFTDFFVFYDRFQHEVRRRLTHFKEDRSPRQPRRKMPPRRRN